MAVSLKGDDLGRLVDPFGGRRDLEARTIRVLHNLSFIDDPTRIFRAIRYENRYGFRMDEHTLRLARGDVEMGLVGDLSSARLRDELEALLEEGEIEHSILRLAELGADRAIHPHLAADEEAVRARSARWPSSRARYGLEVPSWRLGLAVLARRLPPDEVYDWLAAAEGPPPRRRADRGRGHGRPAARRAAAETAPSRPRCVALAEPLRAGRAALRARASPTCEPLRAYFERLRDVRLEVTGADLAELGLDESPRVGEILAELRRRKLNGELDGRDSELAAARELIARE